MKNNLIKNILILPNSIVGPAWLLNVLTIRTNYFHLLLKRESSSIYVNLIISRQFGKLAIDITSISIDILERSVKTFKKIHRTQIINMVFVIKVSQQVKTY